MAEVLFLGKSLDDFVYWAHNDRKNLDKIQALLEDIERDGANKGIGKPERLKYKSGWSRRIDKENRLIYEVKENYIAVISCKGHYDE